MSSAEGSRKLSFVVPEDEAGVRLDVFLSARVPGASRRRAKLHLREKLVRVNGRVEKDGYLVRAGDDVTVDRVFESPAVRPELVGGVAAALKLITVIYEDEHLFIISKPPGMPSVVHESTDPLTAADCTAAYSRAARDASPDPREGGLVQRLDTPTSGIMLVAKHREIWATLRAKLFDQQITKTYLAIVEGEFSPVSGQVSWPLRQSRNGKKMEAVRDATVKEKESCGARTVIERLRLIRAQSGKTWSIVRCTICRARRHQVRAHLALAGHPLVGDRLYGSTTSLSEVEIDGVTFPRGEFFLHAESVAFEHPESGELLSFAAPSLEMELCLKQA